MPNFVGVCFKIQDVVCQSFFAPMDTQVDRYVGVCSMLVSSQKSISTLEVTVSMHRSES